MPHATDLALARRVLAADPAAFERLFERFYRCVYVHAQHQLGDVFCARRVTEASLQEALETLSQYDGTVPLAAFVLAITRRQVARELLASARARAATPVGRPLLRTAI